MELLIKAFDLIRDRVNQASDKLVNISENAVGWVGILLLNCAFIPNLIAVLLGVADKLPTVDVVLFVWTGLLLFFLQAIARKNYLNIITIGVGFFIQAVVLAMIVFK